MTGKAKQDWVEVGLGAALIAAAVIPTPDDVTVVSPAAQLGAGILMVAHGLRYLK